LRQCLFKLGTRLPSFNSCKIRIHTYIYILTCNNIFE
jgi:hypothetical protein